MSSITIPNSVTSIGEGAFELCTGLSSVIFINQQNLQSVGASIFGGGLYGGYSPITTVTYYNTTHASELKGNISSLFSPTPTTINYISGPPTPPTISSVSPVSGDVGAVLTISGTDFIPGVTSVTFRENFDVSATTTSVTNTTISCTVPAGTGSVDVIVTTPGGSATKSSAFTYTLPTPPPVGNPDGPPISNICFPAGTPITCNQGAIPIERLNPEIHTIRGKKIVGITKTVTQDKYLVCFEKDALQKNVPSQKTIISKNHEIFYKSEMKKAQEFINYFENVTKVKYTGEVLYNVLMEEPDKMMVNNLICETLHPENGIAKLYKDLIDLNVEEQNEAISIFNKYVIENNIYNKKDKSKKIKTNRNK